ncbi:MAG: hypothetical protein IJ572_00825 [Bacilli bacterium]|nr:hypothetical protein [Bacilli bacterium]
MKRIFKSRLLYFILGAVIFSSVSTLAYSIISSNVGFTPRDNTWQVNDVKEALDDLHDKYNSKAFLKFCTYVDSEFSNLDDLYSIGTKYLCDPGDGEKRYFYILNIKSDQVEMILDRNINVGTTSWFTAMKYFKTGQDGENYGRTWTNVQYIDLPRAQSVVDAVRSDGYIVEGDNSWCLATGGSVSSCNSSKYAWLFNHLNSCNTRGCTDASDASANGYWLRDVSTSSSQAYRIEYTGTFNQTNPSYSQYFGVRPVIIVFKSNLY